MSKKVIIIGSGIAGLALSVRLRVKGYDVHVFEKNESYGGKLSEFKLGEYRYDFGPKLFTMPELIIDLFKISNRNIDDYFKYKKIEVGCKYFWNDGKVFNAFSDKKKLIREIESEFNIDSKRLNNYLKKSRIKFALTKTIFLEKSLHKLSTYFSLSALKGVLNFSRLDISKSLNQEDISNLESGDYKQVEMDMVKEAKPFYKLWKKIEMEFTRGDGFLDKLCMELVGMPSSRCRPPTRDIREKYRQEAKQMLIDSGTPRVQE